MTFSFLLFASVKLLTNIKKWFVVVRLWFKPKTSTDFPTFGWELYFFGVFSHTHTQTHKDRHTISGCLSLGCQDICCRDPAGLETRFTGWKQSGHSWTCVHVRVHVCGQLVVLQYLFCVCSDPFRHLPSPPHPSFVLCRRSNNLLFTVEGEKGKLSHSSSRLLLSISLLLLQDKQPLLSLKLSFSLDQQFFLNRRFRL